MLRWYFLPALLVAFLAGHFHEASASYHGCYDHRLRKVDGDCGHYYQCVHGAYMKRACEPGTAFNEDRQTCDHPENVPGCGGTTSTTTMSGDCSYQGRHAKDGQTILFLQCTRKATCVGDAFGNVHYYECPAGAVCKDEECVCKDGYTSTRNNGMVVHCSGDAGTDVCTYGDFQLKNGDSALGYHCTKKVTCVDGTFQRVDFQCPTNAECVNGWCECKHGFTGNYENNWLKSCGEQSSPCIFKSTDDESTVELQEGQAVLRQQCTAVYKCINHKPMIAHYLCPAHSTCKYGSICSCDDGYVAAKKDELYGFVVECRKRRKCRPGFIEVNNMCLFFSKEKLTFMQGNEKCRDMGGSLFLSKTLAGDCLAIGKLKAYKEGEFFVAGGKEIDFQTLAHTRDNYVLSFLANVIRKHSMEPSDAVNACRRFSGSASVQEWNYASPLSAYCLTLTASGPWHAKCTHRKRYICQQGDFDDELSFWSSWYSVSQPGEVGEKECLSDILKKYNNEYTGEGDRLCKDPLHIKVREVGTHLWVKKETHGYQVSIGKKRVVCRNKHNDEPACPDLEIQFKCPETKLNDCNIKMVKANCEAQNKECVMRRTGPRCIRKKKVRNPADEMNKDKCHLHGVTYNMHTCQATGDPHYGTLDGFRYDFMGTCNYDFISVCNGYKATPGFPTFNMVVRNYKRVPNVYPSWTKSFSLTFLDHTYVFEQGKFFLNDVEMNPTGYSDSHLQIYSKAKGLTTTLYIQTDFCLWITWDNRHGLWVRVPDVYRNHVCGMCGNFDGDANNDLRKPGTNNLMTSDEMHREFIANGNTEEGCPNSVKDPSKCSDDKYKQLMNPEFCGILNPNSDSPIVQAIKENSTPEALKGNMKALAAKFSECVNDICWDPTTDRCHDLEDVMDTVHQALHIITPEMDQAWRKYANCENTGETRCSKKSNMVYTREYRPRCQNTCDNPDAQADCDDENEESGCVCKEGFYLNAKMDCVDMDNCAKSCIIRLEDGTRFTLNEGEEFWEVPCQRKKKCENGELKTTTQSPCSIHADCIDQGKQCHCHEGYIGDGITCETDKSCKEGYKAYGDKCYKFVREWYTWQQAAVNCGTDGSVLARYDAAVNVELENFFKTLPATDAEAMARTVNIYCTAGKTCAFRRGFLAVEAELVDPDKDEEKCKGKYSLSTDKKLLVVEGDGCMANFQVKIIEESKIKEPNAIRVWTAGNSYIVAQGERGDKAPFQIDPPKMLDLTPFNDPHGCFQANLNKEGKLIVTPNPACGHKKPSICEYDNVGKIPHDPNDFKRIPKLATFQEAVELCKEMDRPLVNIYHEKQKDLVKKMLQLLGADGWVGAGYDNHTQAAAFRWGDKTELSYTNWRDGEPNNYNDNPRSDQKCVAMDKRSGRWYTEDCMEKNYPICGPSFNMESAVYTPCYPVRGFNSVKELKKMLSRQGRSDFVCEHPISIDCKAKREDNGNWVTSVNQQGLRALTCTKDKIQCKDGQGVDCRTFKVCFLCPQSENQCHTLKEEGIEPCAYREGSACIPVRNHYKCNCVNRDVWDKQKKKCASPCGWCQASGDPHFTAFTGFKYDQQGRCMFKFAGTCPLPEFENSANFDVYSKNVECGRPSRKVACVNYVEVHLRNVEYTQHDVKRTGNFVFKVPRMTGVYYYNDAEQSEGVFGVEGVFRLVRKRDYFYLDAQVFGLKLEFRQNRLKMNLPDMFARKMCGLCGDCGAVGRGIFRNKDMSEVTIPDGLSRHEREKLMDGVASQWIVPFDGLDPEMCKVVPPPRICTDAMTEELSHPKKCGIFKDTNGPLADCFEKVDPAPYYDDCVFDACNAEPMPFICQSVAVYVKSCLEQHHIFLDWRRDEFCPMDCKDKVYRLDASCEPMCGREVTGDCEEDPGEGCVCPNGLMRQGDRCVRASDCGCKHTNSEGETMSIKPGEERVIPSRCEEVAHCVVDEKDGSTRKVIRVLPRDPNSICDNGKVSCKRGYVLQADDTCKKDDRECSEGFEDKNGVCIVVPPTLKTWRGAIQACNLLDGTLVFIDSIPLFEDVVDIMKENLFEQVFISGHVRAVQGPDDRIVFKPVIKKSDMGKIQYYNFYFHEMAANEIQLDPDITVESLGGAGRIMALVARMGPEGKASIVAVPGNTYSNFVCEPRRPSPPDFEWYGPCNSDNLMADDGDQETKQKLKLMEDCNVCPEPMDIECVPLPFPGTAKGECRITKDGTYYSCDEGKDCVDHAIKTKCSRDVNECTEGLHDCPERSTCVNTIGAYKCKCDKEFPIMVKGKCHRSNDCIIQGPLTVGDDRVNVKGFDKLPGHIPYNCPYKIFETCDGKYDEGSALPFLSLTAYTKNTEPLTQLITGTVGDPITGHNRSFLITEELLKQGKISYGVGKDHTPRSLGFTCKMTRTTFTFIPPDRVSVTHVDNVFEFQLRFPITFKILLSAKYAEMGCGMCTFGPDVMNAPFYITTEDESLLSGEYLQTSGKCSPNVVPDPTIRPPTTAPPPTEAPTTRPPTTESSPVSTKPTTTTPPPTESPATTTPPPTERSLTTEPATTIVLPTESPSTTIPATTTTPPPTEAPVTTEPATTIVLPTEGPATTRPATTTTPPSPPTGTPFATTALPTAEAPPQPPPTATENPPPKPCYQDVLDFCTALSSLCSYDKAACEDQLCESIEGNQCAFLEIADISTCRTGQDMMDFLELLHCNDFCTGKDMSFAYTSGEAPERCQNIVGENPENALHMNMFACRCDKGYKLSGDVCVPEEECGCVLDDGLYVKAGENVVNPTCTKRTICLGNNVKEVDNIRCHREAACLDTPTGRGCVCRDGFFGDGYGPQGCIPPEQEDDTKVCYSKPNYESVMVRQCTCKDGYVSNCTSCVDLDECAEKEHDCDLSKERCENTVGSYTCSCAHGYEPVNGDCKDINECSRGYAQCGAHEGCVNTPGSFECRCCAGFQYNVKTAQCELDSTSGIQINTAQPKCCLKCDYPALCKESEGGETPVPYCYRKPNNGGGYDVQFSSYKMMFQQHCVNNVRLDRTLVTRGECPVVVSTEGPPGASTGGSEPTTPTPTTNNGSEGQTTTPANGAGTTKGSGGIPVLNPTASCYGPEFCQRIKTPPSLQAGEVCGPTIDPKRRTYPNYCAMARVVCLSIGGIQTLLRTPIEALPGKCPSTTTATPITQPPPPPAATSETASPTLPPEMTSRPAPVETTTARPAPTVAITEIPPPPKPEVWSPWSPCRVNNAKQPCGLGVRSRYRSTVLDDGTHLEVKDTYEERVCFKACNPDHIDFTPDLCPPDDGVCGEIDEKVCGSVGPGSATNYDNECELNIAACRASVRPYVVQTGDCNEAQGKMCSDGPVEVQVRHMATYGTVRCVGEPKYINTCLDLWCKGGYENCCMATGYAKVVANIQCFDEDGNTLSSQPREYLSATGCKCRANEDEEAGMSDMTP